MIVTWRHYRDYVSLGFELRARPNARSMWRVTFPREHWNHRRTFRVPSLIHISMVRLRKRRIIVSSKKLDKKGFVAPWAEDVKILKNSSGTFCKQLSSIEVSRRIASFPSRSSRASRFFPIRNNTIFFLINWCFGNEFPRIFTVESVAYYRDELSKKILRFSPWVHRKHSKCEMTKCLSDDTFSFFVPS